MFLFKIFERVKYDFPKGFLKFKNFITAKKDRNVIFMDGILEGFKYFDITDLVEFFITQNIFPTVIPKFDRWICIVANKTKYKYKMCGFNHDFDEDNTYKSWETAVIHIIIKCFEILEKKLKNKKEYISLINSKASILK